MAIVLEMTYGKKIGLPEYSSHQFAVTLRRELASLEDIDAEVERGYAQLQGSVDQQITETGFVPGDTPPPSPKSISVTEEKWSCSAKQRGLIEKLIGENSLQLSDIESLAVERFGHGLPQLNKLEASGLIDELFQRCGRNGNSRQRTPSRRAA